MKRSINQSGIMGLAVAYVPEMKISCSEPPNFALCIFHAREIKRNRSKPRWLLILGFGINTNYVLEPDIIQLNSDSQNNYF
jgi:hypothetical protein